ncbi:MAG TPA: hypothetical protein VGR57_16755 [Ktedonobacterales bacterium]|nr:hypothetical protein [Ktedonobacterales bacterium]
MRLALTRVTISRVAATLLVLGVIPAVAGAVVPHPSARLASGRITGPTVSPAVKHDVSPALRTLTAAIASGGGPRVSPRPPTGPLPKGKPNGLKAFVQPRVAPNMPAPSSSFDGIGATGSIPPDPNGAVGPRDYVEMVNESFAVFNKDPSRGAVGAIRYGPVANNTLWSGVGGPCQTNNDGDPIVVYDSIADRWVITQFAINNTTTYDECVAVSTGGDPTGSYYRYVFGYAHFIDYPKIGLWPDAYYVTYNLYQSLSNQILLGVEACAFDRVGMLRGAAANQVCFFIPTSTPGGTAPDGHSLLPATLDGSRLPPAGSPNYLVSRATTTSLAFWKFHADFATPSNSTLAGPTSIAVAAFSPVCVEFGCIPQPGTTQTLDALGDRLMYRLAYRNFGSYESLVVDHAVTAGSSVGMRWYEIRSPGATPTLYQEGTYAPDANYRWMGSIAQDHVGDMAMGFSLSSGTVYPSIALTGRLASDALGTMPQGEEITTAGGGSQTGASYSYRWGDYTSMAVDPGDDCTFWYVNEYQPSTGTHNWKTRIVAFAFPSCPGTQLIQNGGFESGTANWTGYSFGGRQPIYGSAQAHSGAQAYFPCGYAACDDRVSQTVTVPATVNSATLSYWLKSFSALGALPGAPCLDHFSATLATPDGTVISGGTLQPLCETAATGGYTRETFDVTSLLQAHAGQQLTLMLRGTTANLSGASWFTVWGVDDVSLQVA